MNADGTQPAALTETPIIEESPDWQPLPITVGRADQPRRACGDLSLLPGGVASVVAVKTRCRRALRIAAHWPGRTRDYRCTAAPHTFDQVLVQCEHHGPKKGVAFVARAPVSASG